MTASVSASVSVLSSVSASTSSALVKLANGEYTAASVVQDSTDATKLGLVKEKDGNYGTSAPSQVQPSTSASSSSSSGVQSALSSLTLGGS